MNPLSNLSTACCRTETSWSGPCRQCQRATSAMRHARCGWTLISSHKDAYLSHALVTHDDLWEAQS